jgi:hypothetical protein
VSLYSAPITNFLERIGDADHGFIFEMPEDVRHAATSGKVMEQP